MLNAFKPLWCTERVCLSAGWQKRGRYGAEWCVLWKRRAQKSNLSHTRLFIYSSPIFYHPACLSGGLSERMSPDSAPHMWHFRNLTDGFCLSWTYRAQILSDGLQLACVWRKRTANPVREYKINSHYFFCSSHVKTFIQLWRLNHEKKNILHYKQLYRIICPLKVLDGGCCWVYTLIHWASAELVWGMEERLGLISPLKSRLWEAEKMLRCSNSKQDKSIFVFYTIEESCSEENKVFVSLHSLLGSIVKRFCGQLHKKCYYPVLRLISEWVVVKCCWYDIYFFIIYNV